MRKQGRYGRKRRKGDASVPQRVPAPIELKPAQKKAVDALVDGSIVDLTRGAYEALTGMSRSQAAYDLADLVEAGVLERLGSGRSTRYRLAGRPGNGQRRWTTDSIRIALDRFCDGRADWPSPNEFKAAGHWDLYVAASRYGGIAFWTAELGFPRRRVAQTRRRRFARPASWAAVGAVASAAAAAAVVALAWPHGRPHLAAAPDPRIVVDRPVKVPVRTSRHSARPHHSHRARRVVARQAAATSGRVEASLTAAVSPPPPPAARVVHATAPPPAGPVPLRAPSGGGGAPAPLPAP